MATVQRLPRVYLVFHEGAPIGWASLTTSGTLGVGELMPERGYLAIRDIVRAASQSLWSVGFLSIGDKEGEASLQRVPLDVVARVAELPLELHDERGSFVPTDFVNIVEQEDATRPPAVFVRFRLERSKEPATSPLVTVPDADTA